MLPSVPGLEVQPADNVHDPPSHHISGTTTRHLRFCRVRPLLDGGEVSACHASWPTYLQGVIRTVERRPTPFDARRRSWPTTGSSAGGAVLAFHADGPNPAIVGVTVHPGDGYRYTSTGAWGLRVGRHSKPSR